MSEWLLFNAKWENEHVGRHAAPLEHSILS